MLTIQNLSYFLGERALYREASLQIKPKDRIGLIGPNGAGKTTLLKLINGDLMPDEGQIARSNDCSIGFLNQDLLSYESQESILAVAMQAFEEALRIQRKIDDILHRLETDYQEQWVYDLAKFQEEFERLQGYTLKARSEEVLEGLGFRTEDLGRPLQQFSGGWRMRVMLAKMLLQKPALLMLDEPTNHLDLPSIQWLENYLTNYEGAVVLVSHDREFLDRAASTIVEVSGGKLNYYAGNYSFYIEEKALRSEIQRNAYENQQQKIKQTEDFISRFRAKATKARQVQSRVKMLERLELVEEIGGEEAAMNIRFRFRQQPGRMIAGFEHAHKAYGENLILTNSTFAVERGDKIAFIGANGKGKSTVLRMIYGSEPFEGKLQMGHNVICSFYAQHQLESLHLENQILEELKTMGVERTETELRNLLGCFLFGGDDVYKKIRVLSGGEKSRVALAKTLVSEANFLLLDEPTNHLDIRSVNILVQALQAYEGSFVVVSHDRFFISEIANKIWYIEDQELKVYPGTYAEFSLFMEQKAAKEKQGTQAQQNKSAAPAPVKSARAPARTPAEEAAWKEADRKLKKIRKQVAEAEEQVARLESRKTELENLLADPATYADQARFAELQRQYQQAGSQLEKASSQWEVLFLEQEELETLLK